MPRHRKSDTLLHHSRDTADRGVGGKRAGSFSPNRGHGIGFTWPNGRTQSLAAGIQNIQLLNCSLGDTATAALPQKRKDGATAIAFIEIGENRLLVFLHQGNKLGRDAGAELAQTA